MFSNMWRFWIQTYSRQASLFSISKIFSTEEQDQWKNLMIHTTGLMYYLEISPRDYCGNKNWNSFGPILYLKKSFNSTSRVTEVRSSRELKLYIRKLCRFVGTTVVERHNPGEEMKSEQYCLISFLFSMVVVFYNINKHTHISAEPCQSSPHSCVYIAQPQPGQTNMRRCNSPCLHGNSGEIKWQRCNFAFAVFLQSQSHTSYTVIGGELKRRGWQHQGLHR